eukprot:Skav233008  [mRNA]  locus=scaffold909:58193:59502:+ [translate_table: standard]
MMCGGPPRVLKTLHSADLWRSSEISGAIAVGRSGQSQPWTTAGLGYAKFLSCHACGKGPSQGAGASCSLHAVVMLPRVQVLRVLVPRAYSALSDDAPLTAIATSEEGVIGMAQVKKDGYVQNLVVKPNNRRKGVASQIICWCATQSRRRGATQLWMHVEPGNQPALRFYQRLGFEVGDEEIYKDRLGVRLTKQL